MRHAMSMIETVIAIVVMGIAVSALPLILTQSQNNNALALQQEAILATKAKVAYILGYEWDARSYDENASVSRVLNTTSSTEAHDAFDSLVADPLRRKGHILADKRRRLWDANITPDNETVGFNDIDDFNGRSETTSVTALDDYIFDVNVTSTVSYVSDGRGSVNYDLNTTDFNFSTTPITTDWTNIKMITVNTTGANGINITLRTFASNIGESGILSKVNW
jgi:Tfp pilus assembly protein PilV